MDVSQYLEIFIEETKEHLQSLNEQLLVLEKEPENKDTINEIFRAAHSLKGMAGTMGYKRMQRLTHDMENVFQEIRNDKMKVSSTLVDGLFRGLDALEGYLDNIVNTQDEGTNDNQDLIDLFAKELEMGLNGGGDAAPADAAAPAAGVAPEAPAASSTTNGLDVLTINDTENEAIAKAAEEGISAYAINVEIQETCVLKAARAFLVFKALEEHGEIIKSLPDAQAVEDEKFDFDFSVVVLSKDNEETLKAAVLNVSEIKDAQIKKLEPKEAAKADTGAGAAAATATATAAATAKAPAIAAPAAKAPDNKAAAPAAKGKPVVNRSVRVDIEKLDDLMNLVSELIIAKNGLVAISPTELATDEVRNGNFREQVEYLERITTNIHQSVMKVRMVPIESVVNRFPRMIRDLSKKLDKKMELYMTGEETELDRTVIDEIGDPLQHILRNAADHGLESNEDRVKAGKPEVGSIFLDAYQEGNNVIIEVRDDGGGIDVEKVKRKAIEKGSITEEQAETMTDKDFIDLLFRPSFSTAEKISDVSGRGVGLDVVKTKIEALGGSVECKTVLGEGSTFTIRLPLTLAIIQALMVVIGNEKYAIPLGSIQTIEDIQVSDIKYVEGKEVIHLRGSVIPLVRLDQILDVPDSKKDSENLTVVIVTKGDKLAGLIVDDLIGQLEIVIKSIGKYINNCKMISGATILGDGEIALILDANTLV
ncbi:MAG: chemotaxis protein CheA [Lachnospiraceae bacterium]|nr:chemotaxis protein CheA [Lachnospiraceae bacterium]